jgi:hypothetical protein
VFFILNFPMRILILNLLAAVIGTSLTYFFFYHVYLNLYDVTELERKYRFRKLDEEIKGLGFFMKIKMAYVRLINTIKGRNIIDLFWPD